MDTRDTDSVAFHHHEVYSGTGDWPFVPCREVVPFSEVIIGLGTRLNHGIDKRTEKEAHSKGPVPHSSGN